MSSYYAKNVLRSLLNYLEGESPPVASPSAESPSVTSTSAEYLSAQSSSSESSATPFESFPHATIDGTLFKQITDGREEVWTIVERLGSGTYGSVSKQCRSTSRGTEYRAVKTIFYPPETREIVKSIERELSALKALRDSL